MGENSNGLTGTTYQGSLIFSEFASSIGLPIDQFNFLFCQILALIFSICFRYFLAAKAKNVVARHFVGSKLHKKHFFRSFLSRNSIFSRVPRFWSRFFLFRFPDLAHLRPVDRRLPFARHCSARLFSLTGFCILHDLFERRWDVETNFRHFFRLKTFLLFFLQVHIYRLIYDYGNYTLDVSGPLMINTQKLTALAFSLYDGFRSKEKNENLNSDQNDQKIVSVPTPLKFVSYVFYFQGICVGPLCFYRDYVRFIDGENLRKIGDDEFEQPSILRPVLTKFVHSFVWALVLLFLTPKFTVERNLDEEMIQASLFHRISYLLFSLFCARGKFVDRKFSLKKSNVEFSFAQGIISRSSSRKW